MISFVEERSTPEPASSGPDATPAPTAPPAPRPAGSLFKLRLGVPDTAAPQGAGRADSSAPRARPEVAGSHPSMRARAITHTTSDTGADPVAGADLLAGAKPGGGADPADGAPAARAAGPANGSTPVVPTFASIRADLPRAGEWDEFPAAVHEDSRREYKSDSDFQAMIAALADQIAVHDDPQVPAPARGQEAPARAPRARDRSDAVSTDVAVARAVEDAAAAAFAAAAAAAAAAGAATSPAASPPSEDVVDPPASSAGATVATIPTAGDRAAQHVPAVAAAGDVPGPDEPLVPGDAAAVRAPGLEELADVEPTTEPVEVPSIVEALPALPETQPVPPPPSLPLGRASKRVVDRVSGSTEHEVIVPRPTLTLAGPSLLPKIEAEADAPRPTKPVDFRSLLKEAAVPAAPGAVKRGRRRQRHPFRALVKLAVILGLLGGGLYVAKVRFLDTKWQSEIEAIALDVAERRGLQWDHAVDVVTLPADEYALRLASSMTGIDSAETNVVGGEWRALGLTEGAVDLGAIGAAATPDQPAFYEPVDDTVYAVTNLSDALRELSLSRALTNALLDQHHRWGDRLAVGGVPAAASTRLGVRALFDGDALAIRADTVAAVLADPTIAKQVSDEIAGMRLSAAPLARGASPYAVALSSQPGAAARSLFTREMAPATRDRNTVEGLAVTNDAAIFDALRGRAATSEVPSVATPATTATIPTTVPSAAAAPPTVAAEGTAAEPAAASAPATTTASARGLVYWYYVLASRLDSGEAWRAALLWRGDGTSTSATPAGICVDAVIATRDALEQDQLVGALGRWAAAAPPASATSVTEPSDTTVAVHACDPGPDAKTVSNALVPLFGAAPEELLVASELRGAGLPPNEQARTCVVERIRRDGFPPLLRSTTVDSSLTHATLDITSPEVRALIAACASA